MADNRYNNNKLEILDDTMHKWIVPASHAALWFFGLYFAKYGAQLLGVDSAKENVVNILNLVPAFLVFIFEMAVSLRDIRVYKKMGKKLDVSIMTYLSRFIAVIGVVVLFGILYTVKPKADFLFVLLMVFSVVLKFMEYYLMNNIDSFFEERPEELSGPFGDAKMGYRRNG